MGSPAEIEQARLRWRCRRGMRELDVLLERWLQRHWPNATPDRRQAFEALLECEDDRLWAWLTGREHPGTLALAALVDELLGQSSA